MYPWIGSFALQLIDAGHTHLHFFTLNSEGPTWRLLKDLGVDVGTVPVPKGEAAAAPAASAAPSAAAETAAATAAAVVPVDTSAAATAAAPLADAAAAALDAAALAAGTTG